MTPSSRSIWLLFGVSLGPLAYAILGIAPLLALVLPVAFVAMLIYDRVAGVRADVSVHREVPRVFSVGAANPVILVVACRRRVPPVVEIVDETFEPSRVKQVDDLVNVHLKSHESMKLEYHLIPLKRGSYQFFGIQMRYMSRMGLWRVRRRFDVPTSIQVFPDISAVSRFELLARENNLREIGLRSMRMAGAGVEFERMREYRAGDEPRTVDWKTTARLGKLVVREMGEERNQNVLMAIDMGTMMRQTSDGMTHFDYALNTAIFLSHIASKKGDNVGVILFNDRIVKYLPLTRGIGAVDNIVANCFDVEPSPVATDYDALFQFVMHHVQKRSLLITMTHLGFEEEQSAIEKWSRELVRYHLPLFVFFKEPQCEARLMRMPSNKIEEFQSAALARALVERRQAMSRLHNNGIMAIESLPAEHSAVAINSYLGIKTRNML